MRAPVLVLALVAAAVLGGCTQVDVYDPSISVTMAGLEEGDCVFGARDNASDPAWCHVLSVRVFNPGQATELSVQADRWSADTNQSQTLTLPRVEGAEAVARGEVETITLRFDAPDHVRLVRLHYRDDLYRVHVAADVLDYPS